MRTFYLFDDATLQVARDCWRALGTRDGATSVRDAPVARGGGPEDATGASLAMRKR